MMKHQENRNEECSMLEKSMIFHRLQSYRGCSWPLKMIFFIDFAFFFIDSIDELIMMSISCTITGRTIRKN